MQQMENSAVDVYISGQLILTKALNQFNEEMESLFSTWC